jgi:acetylornithine deacetylase/succinyl-diaminopimelate desuccinylase-like protein
MGVRSIGALAAALLCGAGVHGATKQTGPTKATAGDATVNALARSIFQELIEINTTESQNSRPGGAACVTTAAAAMEKRLRAAGFPESDLALVGPNARKQNLVARLRGTGEHQPVLLIGHLDVVEAHRDDWSTDPFKFVEQDGYFYGRGTQDMKDGDAIMVATLIRLRQSGFKPHRDIILALTADEEGGSSNGVDWLLKNRRDLVDAEFVINHDGSSIVTDHGKLLYYELDATEKVYGDYQLVVTNPGGHSSLPVPENAIYTLAAGLGRLQKFEFPFELNAVTRAYYEQVATIETGQRAQDMRGILQTPPDSQAIARLSQDPVDHAIVHTTCVATRLEGGHANNALPQRAVGVVNCRILPGHSPEEVRRTIINVLNDERITVRYIDDNGQVQDKASDRKGYPPPALEPEIMQPLTKLVSVYWPGLKVVPNMSAGASDGVYTSAAGLPTYTITGIAIDKDNERAHGRDERLGVESFYKGNEFFYQYIRALTSR